MWQNAVVQPLGGLESCEMVESGMHRMWVWVPERILGGVLAVDSMEIGRARGRSGFCDLVSYIFKIK